MAQRVAELRCPGCGAAVSIDMKKCEYCGNPVVITTFNSVYTMAADKINEYATAYGKLLAAEPENAGLNAAAGMCYLKLGLYEKAYAAFCRAMEADLDNSEVYYYAAVSLLHGKKPFLHPRETINRVMEYINAANRIEPRGIYGYFLAYIKYDYFERKYLNIVPDYRAELEKARQEGVSDFDITTLFSLLGLPRAANL